ncbi:uncharacterized protein LOC131254145 [Magnolia sinica]|uniref:uncharacterized protein LOC131254145 n=1 Tax=Magnolia sinica TaxID=86752 RepID=UPI002658B46A|nr:uncharacterized protein LOC131254145 [Magnolia sinica]
MVSLATYLLEGEAENWWQSLQQSVLATCSWTWAGFKAKFFEKYFPWSCCNEKITQFLWLEQGSLTVAKYEARFNELSQYVPKALEDVKYKLQKFKEGLRPGIQSRLCIWDFEDFAELVDKAMWVEKDFERTMRTRPPARDTQFRRRQAPPTPRMRDQGISLPVNRPQQNQAVARVAPRPQQPRQGSLAQQRAPQARVYAVAATEAEQDPLQTIHGTAHINGTLVLTLFDSGANLSFIDSAIASRLALNTTRMHVPLVGAPPMGKFVEIDKVCKACPITLANREVAVDLIVMPVWQFDVILGMDWLTLALEETESVEEKGEADVENS